MADTEVSDLSAATAPVAPADMLLLIQGSTSKRTTVAHVRDSPSSSSPRVNDYLLMAAPGTLTGAVQAGGTWRGGPLKLPLGCSWDRIRLNVDTAGTSGCTARVVLFNDDATTPGRPGVVLLDSSNFAADAAAAITLTVSITPTTQVVWAGITVNGSPATGPRFAFLSSSAQNIVWPSEDSSGPVAYYSGTAFSWGITMSGAAADNPTMTAHSINGQPRFAFRRSA